MSMGREIEMDAIVESAGLDALADQQARDVEAGLWRRRDGSAVPVASMTLQHLKNSLEMLKRKSFIGARTREAYFRGAGPRGDMAQEAFDLELDEVLNAKVSPYFDLLEDEIKRREVTP